MVVCFIPGNNIVSNDDRSYEQVAMLFGKDMDQWDKAIDYFQRACGMYREHGVPDTAAMCLDRGAK